MNIEILLIKRRMPSKFVTERLVQPLQSRFHKERETTSNDLGLETENQRQRNRDRQTETEAEQHTNSLLSVCLIPWYAKWWSLPELKRATIVHVPDSLSTHKISRLPAYHLPA